MNVTEPSKEAVVLKLLEEGDTMLCLDARYPGVLVPKRHSQNSNLRLILNLDFPRPIEVTSDGISANLAFEGRRFACYIPMNALWAAFNPQTRKGMMWPDSVPPEVLAELKAEQREADKGATFQTSATLTEPRVIAGKKTTSARDPEDNPSKRPRDHLQVIK